MNIRVILPALVVFASACSALGASSGEQTLVAENEFLKTRAAFVDATATREIDRVMITLEHARTEVRNVNRQNQDLVATLIERGTPTEAIVVSAAGVVNLPTTATPGAAAVPVPAGTEARAVEDAMLDGASTPAGSPPMLAQIVMARGVGSDDCAINEASQFTSSTAQIYVVARASNIAPGMTLSSRWFREDAEVAFFEFTPDFRVDDACVWFFIDQTDAQFTPGEWSVQLAINGGNVGAPISFVIVPG